MNTIQISRGDLALRLKDSAGYLKPGEYSIQTVSFNKDEKWRVRENGEVAKPKQVITDFITKFKYTPQIGDIFIGCPQAEGSTEYAVTRIGSSNNLINQYSFNESGKFAVRSAKSIINSGSVRTTAYEPNHLYMYSDVTPANETGLINIDGKPIELADTDVFIYLGEGAYTDPLTGNETTAKYAVKMSGSSSAKAINLPQVDNPNKDSKSNQTHSFYGDSSLLDTLYDIDRLKLSHYESQGIIMANPSNASEGAPKLDSYYAGDSRTGADYRFVTKKNLLKYLLQMYCNNNGGKYNEADFDYQVARIQGTEWKFYKVPLDEMGQLRCPDQKANKPLIVLDDDKLPAIESVSDLDNDLGDGRLFKKLDPNQELNETNVAVLNTEFLDTIVIRDGLGKAVNVFFPNDEIIVKIKPNIIGGKKPSESLVTLNSEEGNDVDPKDSGTEVVRIKLDLDNIEITRRGDGSNPNYDPTNVKDGKDLGPADPHNTKPRFGPRANDVAINYWMSEDQKLRTNEDAIVSLFKSKADVDDEGHIFTSQLPRTVVGGMQRRGTISDLYSFLIFATGGLNTTLESPGAQPNPSEMLSIAAHSNGYTSWRDLLNDLGLDKLFEIDEETGKITKSKIDVGDYFIYSGPKLEVGTKENDENWGKTSFIEDYEKHYEKTPWFYDSENKKDPFKEFTLTDLLTYSNGGEKVVTDDLFNLGRLGGVGYTGLLNGLKGVNYIKPGDIFVVEKITCGDTVADVDKASSWGKDKHANPDTEDGFVLQMSLISSAADAVTGLIIENNNNTETPEEVTGVITLKPEKRKDSGHDETTIRAEGKNTIVIGTDSVLWTKFKSEEGHQDATENLDFTIPLIDKTGFARHSNAKFMPDWSLNLGALVSNEFKSPIEEGEFNPFASIRYAANLIKGESDASSLSLKFATSTKSNAFTQVFQAENGVIALLSDIDDTPPEDENSMKAQLHWHVRKEYVKTGEDENGHPIYKVQYHNSFLRDGGGKKCDVDNHDFTDDGRDTNFFKNWISGAYRDKDDDNLVYVDHDRAFVFYNRDKQIGKDENGDPITLKKQTVKFVLASVENQDTSFEKEPDLKEELESVQTLPRHSGVLLNSRSIIDCGEWL